MKIAKTPLLLADLALLYILTFIFLVPLFSSFPAKKKSSEAKVLLAGIHTAEIAYFAEQGAYSPDLIKRVGFQPASNLRYYRALLVGMGKWPPDNMDLNFEGSAEEIVERFKSVPGLSFYGINNDKFVSLSEMGPNEKSSAEGFWALAVGNIDFDSQADVWLGTSENREPVNLIDDEKINPREDISLGRWLKEKNILDKLIFAAFIWMGFIAVGSLISGIVAMVISLLFNSLSKKSTVTFADIWFFSFIAFPLIILCWCVLPSLICHMHEITMRTWKR